MMLTEQRNLRSGTVSWRDADWNIPSSATMPVKVEIAVIGAGIMGAIIADRFAREGFDVALFDRRPPGSGSTAASTAEIMWAMDVPLSHLAREIGAEDAVRRWRRVFHAVAELRERLGRIPAARVMACPTLYLAGNLLEEGELEREAKLRSDHGLPSRFLSNEEVAGKFGIAGRAAIVSEGSFAIDPVGACHMLIAGACNLGAKIVYPAEVVALHPRGDGVELEFEDGRSISAREVILATGYERPSLLLPAAFKLFSTFAIATPPGVAPAWRERAMIWEASDPYLYVREGTDGRIIAGGEDLEISGAANRDALLPESAGRIAAKLEQLIGSGSICVDRQWCATFGSSPDGLPAIGRAAIMEHVWLAYGYGGNGIAFASLAADMLSRLIKGDEEPDAACFDPYRFD